MRRTEFKLAGEILGGPRAKDCWIDLHARFSEIDERTLEELFTRSRLSRSGQGTNSRILGLEGHLALLSIHLLKHGAWRPLWLCDIGAAIESLPASFDWEICLGRNKTRARWIRCAIGLATKLLGARGRSLPNSPDSIALPSWLVENVLRQWANPLLARNQSPMRHPIAMVDLLRQPAGLLDGLRQRWPNAIIATVSVNGEFNNLPRLPYQMANCIYRVGRFIVHRPSELHEH